MILLLAIVGGSVDAVMILGFNVLTGAQTGNTVLLGVAVAQGQLATALGSIISVIGYIIGAAIGELIIVRHREHWPWPSVVSTVLIAELIPLCCLLIFWRLAGPHPAQETMYTLIIYAASAMGIQSAAMLCLHNSPTTTYITGTLTTFATKLIRWLRLVEGASHSSPGRRDLVMQQFSAIDSLWIYGLTWFVYVTGAIAGGLLFLHTRELALLLSIVAIVLVVVAARRAEIEGQAAATEI